MTTDKLTSVIKAAADQCEAEGVVVNGDCGGPVHHWVRNNVEVSLENEFYVVFLLTCELAERKQKKEF